MNKNEVIEAEIMMLDGVLTQKFISPKVFNALSLKGPLRRAYDAGSLAERSRVIEILQRRQIGIVANLPVSARTNSAHIREEFRMAWQHMINEIEAIEYGK